jgi:hypothetical protein
VKISDHNFRAKLFLKPCPVVSLSNQRANGYAQLEQLPGHVRACSAVPASAADRKDRF